MNWLRKIVSALRRRKKEKAPNGEGRCQVLLKMGQPVINPADLTEGLGIAIAMETRSPVHLVSTEVRLYNVSSLGDGEFLGCFYAVRRGDFYYGNLVGECEIVSCRKDAFHFEKTDKLLLPLKMKGEKVWFVLEFQYSEKRGQLKPRCLKELSLSDRSERVLHQFPDGETIAEALNYCKKELGI